jgi:hypothetical protein
MITKKRQMSFRIGSVLTLHSFGIFSQVLREFWPKSIGNPGESPKNSAGTTEGIPKECTLKYRLLSAKWSYTNHGLLKKNLSQPVNAL